MPLLDESIQQQLAQYPGGVFPMAAPQQPNFIGRVMQALAGEKARQQAFATQFAQNPQAAIQATPQDIQHYFNVATAMGGADITKEQKAAWEAENEAYRAGRHPGGLELSPGTRVSMRPWGQRTANPASIYGPGKLQPNEYGDMAGGTGVIVTPGTPEAGEPAYTPSTEATRRPPTPDHVAVRGEQSGHWFWRHRDSLEVLPPKEEWSVGTPVQYAGPRRGQAFSGTIGEPPKSSPSPGKDWVWVESDVGPNERPRGGWFHKKDLHRPNK